MLNTEVEEIVRACAKEVKLEKECMKLEEERYENWKGIWRKLKNTIEEGTKELGGKRFVEKKMQKKMRIIKIR